MGQRITKTDIIRQAARLAEVARQSGLWDPEDVAYTLDEGSPTYGRAWRLNALRRGSSAHYRPAEWLGNDYLGWTKAEVFDQLSTRLRYVMLESAEPIDWTEVDRVVDDAERRRYLSWQSWSDVAPWKLDEHAGAE